MIFGSLKRNLKLPIWKHARFCPAQRLTEPGISPIPPHAPTSPFRRVFGKAQTPSNYCYYYYYYYYYYCYYYYYYYYYYFYYY